MQIDWVGVLSSFLSGAFGAGLMWGTLRQKVEHVSRRVEKMEIKLEEQVGEEHCREMRVDCQTRIDRGFNKIDTQLSNIMGELKTIAIWMAKHNGD